MTELGTRRRRRLARARLYLVCDADFGAAGVRAALDGGADIVQLREKDADDAAVLSAAADFRRATDEHGALFVLNDRPDLAAAAGADGVHIGQDDASPARARAIVGDDAIVGLSTHTTAEADAARRTGVDYLCVGPVHATPTKAGRHAVGLDPVRHAAATGGHVPWFAIGGLNAGNVREVLDAGARRIVVVRAITEAPDPEAAARRLRAVLDAAAEVGVGAA
jgi:thiamine-phosphate pyrophosphorylase